MAASSTFKLINAIINVIKLRIKITQFFLFKNRIICAETEENWEPLLMLLHVRTSEKIVKKPGNTINCNMRSTQHTKKHAKKSCCHFGCSTYIRWILLPTTIRSTHTTNNIHKWKTILTKPLLPDTMTNWVTFYVGA